MPSHIFHDQDCVDHVDNEGHFVYAILKINHVSLQILLPIIIYGAIDNLSLFEIIACRRVGAIWSPHDVVIKWKHFPRYWPFVRGIHRSPVNSPHKGQWRGALMFSLICTRINGWVNNGKAGDLGRHRAHYDVTVMTSNVAKWSQWWLAHWRIHASLCLNELTRCGLVTLYDDIEMDENWLRKWFLSRWHRVITWTNVVISKVPWHSYEDNFTVYASTLSH